MIDVGKAEPMDASHGPGDEIHFRMSRAEALVLFDWVQCHEEDLESLVGDPAEQAVLWGISALLERLLPEPFRQDYPDLIEAARAELRPAAE